MREITGGKGAALTFDPVAGPFIGEVGRRARLRGGIIFEYGASVAASRLRFHS